MDCTQAQEEFAALLDGELAPEERAAVERHLSQCSDCLRDLDGLKRVDTIYRQLSSVSAPEGFEERIRPATRPGTVLRFPGLGRQPKPWWPAVAAAAVFALVLGAVALRSWLPTGESEMTMASLEKGTPPPAPAPLARALPEEAKPQAATNTATPVASPPQAGVMADIAPAPPAAAEAPAPPQEAMLMAKPDIPVPDKGVKLKAVTQGPELEASRLRVDMEPSAAPIAQDNAPSQDFFMKERATAEAGQTLDAADAPPASVSVEMPSAPAAAPAPVEMAAPAPPSPAREADMQSAPPQAEALAMPKIMAEPPATKEEAATIEAIGMRNFEQRNGVWYEAGYKDQETTRLVRGSAELRKLVSAHADLGKVLELGERVVFKADGKWYRVDPRAVR